MSHFVECSEVHIVDLDAFERAANGLGFRLVRGQQRANGWAYSHGHRETIECEHALVRDDDAAAGYEVALLARGAEGEGWRVAFDSTGSSKLQAICGANLCTLLRDYADHAVQAEARQNGLEMLHRVVQNDGRIVIQLAASA